MKINVNALKLSALLLALPLTVNAAQDELVEQGKYLAKLGDCTACHTIDVGQANGGGLPFTTPFGIVYSTNISSDEEFGIGHYSLEDFTDAMRGGVAPKGNLYPAMPYTSYHLLTDQDIEALYRYFMSTKPVKQENRDNDLMFPTNIRMGLKAWNLVNHDSKVFEADADKSEEWNRGSYIVNGLGHCGECHTPRDVMFAMDQSRHFEGELIGGAEASDITPQELNRQGWTKQDLDDVLRKGYSRKGTVFAGMYPVVFHSFSHLTKDDMSAVTSYLLDNDAEVAAKPDIFNGHDKSDPGYALYSGYCAGCHGIDGEGKPNVSPALIANATIDKAVPINTLSVMLNGVEEQRYSHTHGFYAMPSYRDTLNVKQLTELTNYIRKVWTKQSSDLTESQVQDWVDKIEDSIADAAH